MQHINDDQVDGQMLIEELDELDAMSADTLDKSAIQMFQEWNFYGR